VFWRASGGPQIGRCIKPSRTENDRSIQHLKILTAADMNASAMVLARLL